jgi:hypothetical protein
MLSRSTTLQHAILALAAFDYPESSQIHGLRTYALHHKSLSLQLLQNNIENLVISREDDFSSADWAANMNETLLAVLITCICDITTGSTKEWVAHLRGACALIGMTRGTKRTKSAVQFARQYFLARDAFSCMAIDTESCFSKGITHERTPGSFPASFYDSIPGSTVVNVHTGCPEKLVSLVAAVTSLARDKYRSRRAMGTSLDKEQEFLMTATAIQCNLDKLENFESEESGAKIQPIDRLSPFTSVHQQLNLYYLIFRRATHLYLRYAGFDAPIAHPNIQQSLLPDLLSLISRIDIHERTVYPLWPLFIASCMAVTEENRTIVLDQFERLHKVWKCGNVGVTEQAVHWIWKCYDIDVRPLPAGDKQAVALQSGTRSAGGTRECPSARVNFEWHAPLHRLGWTISLT